MVQGRLFWNGIIVGSLPLFLASNALAFSYKMNAMCYLQDTPNAPIQAFNPSNKEIKDSGSARVKKVPTLVTDEDVQKKFRIASVSKVITTHWAVATLGPEYRFKTKINISPTEPDNSCDVHLTGDMDLFMGKEMLSSVFQQLKPILANQNCSKIALLSFDEKFLIPFNSAEKLFILQHRQDATFRGSNPTLYYGLRTTTKALSYFIRNFGKIPTLEIKPKLASEFRLTADRTAFRTYSFQSRPLYMMMREFNAYSSNVPPNILFERLGGIPAYKEFIANRLKLDANHILMFNGSGYPVGPEDDKSYNEVSCAGIVRILQDLDHMLKSYQGSKTFQMADVMAVGGDGEVYSTFKSLYGSSTFSNTLTAKTGSADRAITFAGMLSTTEGSLYFGTLTEPDSYEPDQLNKPRMYIRDLVSILAERFQLKKFNYTQIGLMNPTDAAAKLLEEAPILPETLN